MSWNNRTRSPKANTNSVAAKGIRDAARACQDSNARDHASVWKVSVWKVSDEIKMAPTGIAHSTVELSRMDDEKNMC